MKTLVAYFSAETGKTRKIAEELAKSAGADLYEIKPAEPYSAADLKWVNPLARCNREKLGKKDVPVSGKVGGWEEYDTVYLGFPIWYYGAPNVVSTFCREYDWTGKKIYIFAFTGLLLTVISVLGAELLAKIMNAPKEAFDVTAGYIRICGGGFLIITAYNLLGSIFRGLGDSKTPLIAVGIACVFNIIGDLFFVAVLGLGANGAALATVLAQLISVLISFVIIRRTKLPFEFHRSDICMNSTCAKAIFRIGTPIALQDLLVGVSFLVMLAIVNKIGLTASAGVGVAEKVCAFIMLVPAAFMQSMSAFVAQNYGAGKADRAKQALKTGIAVSFVFGFIMFLLTFFRGDLLAGIFSGDREAVLNAWDYLKAYAIDCLLTCFLFCFIGYYNGIQKTTFVMIQGICGAFCVRIPVAFIMQHFGNGSLFLIGLATPCSTILQITMCFAVYAALSRKLSSE